MGSVVHRVATQNIAGQLVVFKSYPGFCLIKKDVDNFISFLERSRILESCEQKFTTSEMSLSRKWTSLAAVKKMSCLRVVNEII